MGEVPRISAESIPAFGALLKSVLYGIATFAKIARRVQQYRSPQPKILSTDVSFCQAEWFGRA